MGLEILHLECAVFYYYCYVYMYTCVYFSTNTTHQANYYHYTHYSKSHDLPLFVASLG